MFHGDMCILETFAIGIHDEIQLSLFQKAVTIMKETNTSADVPAALESICQVWQEIARCKHCVVDKSQTRTPTCIALDIIATVPSLLNQTNENETIWKQMLDPASGSGLLVAMMIHRTIVESDILIDIKSDNESSDNKSIVDRESVDKNDIRDRQIIKNRKAQRNRLIHFCSQISKCVHAVDIDEMSCMLTRVSILCSMRPLTLIIDVEDPDTHCKDIVLDVVCTSAPMMRTNTWCMPNRFSSPHSRELLLDMYYDIIIQNPPYRNMSREFQENKGRAFSFLNEKNEIESQDDNISTDSNPWSNFQHHNLYGYFLELGRRMARPKVGIMTAVVLRNVFDLHKYPGDVSFHHLLLTKTTILRIRYNAVNSFDCLPHDARHTDGIATVTITLRAGVADENHSVVVVNQGIGGDTETKELVLQKELMECGLGVTDVMLCSKYSRELLIEKWLNEKTAMKVSRT